MNGKRDQPGNERKTRNAPNAANQANSFFSSPLGVNLTLRIHLRWSDMETSGNKLPTVNTACHKLPTVTTNHKHKLPTVKLLACIHGMQKGDGGEGGMWRVVSGKGQILTTYRGPSSREREGGGGTHQGKGENPNPTRGGSGPMA